MYFIFILYSKRLSLIIKPYLKLLYINLQTAIMNLLISGNVIALKTYITKFSQNNTIPRTIYCSKSIND